MINMLKDNALTIIHINSLYNVNNVIIIYLVVGLFIVNNNLTISINSNDYFSLTIGRTVLAIIYGFLIVVWPIVSLVIVVRELMLINKKKDY
jgi:hypothetical protein